MRKPTYPLWLNVVLFQAIWFAAILGQEAWQGLIVLLLAVHV